MTTTDDREQLLKHIQDLSMLCLELTEMMPVDTVTIRLQRKLIRLVAKSRKLTGEARTRIEEKPQKSRRRLKV